MKTLPLIAIGIVLALVGCVHEQTISDASHPDIEIRSDGSVLFRGETVEIEDLPSRLRSVGVPYSSTVNIRVPNDLSNAGVPRMVMFVLAKNGYSRPVCVTTRRAYSSSAYSGVVTPQGNTTRTIAAPEQPRQVVYPPHVSH